MLEYSSKKGFINFHVKIFPEEFKLADSLKFTCYNHVFKQFNTFLFIKKKFNTLLINLENSKEEIFNEFGKNGKYKITRAEREGVTFLLENDVENFVEFYNDFAKSKGQSLLNRSKVLKIPNVVITKAVHNDTDIAMHSYMVDKELKLVRLVNSCSARFSSTLDSGFVGRANRMLHYKDMMWFKDMGCITYDFGGITVSSGDKEKDTIAEFKKGFGGEIVDEYTYMSLPYWLSIKFKRIFMQGADTGNQDIS